MDDHRDSGPLPPWWLDPALAVPGAAAAQDYTSVPCHLNAHPECTHGVARPSDPEVPVVYQICSCFCHEEETG